MLKKKKTYYEKMRKEIKVHILASPHPQFDEILDFPPEGVKYNVVRTKIPYHSWISEHRISLHNALMKVLPIPRMMYINTKADVIHSSRGIIMIKPNKPWIIDAECGHVFTSFNWRAMKNPIVRKIIVGALCSKKCKKILPQSEAAKKTMMMAFGKDYQKFAHKVEVLYLAMRPCEKKKIKRKDGKIILSFVGKEFFGKGAHDLLKAYEILTKKYDNLELKFKGDIPLEYQNLKLPGLKIIRGHFSRDKLFEKMYLSADIFVFPTFVDNYGVVLLEAMSAGLPLIGTTSMTVPELCVDGKNGFIIKTNISWENYTPYGRKKAEQFKIDVKKPHPEIVKQLVEKISKLIENKRLREKMGKESRKMIEEGTFSIKERNKKLEKIYKKALE